MKSRNLREKTCSSSGKMNYLSFAIMPSKAICKASTFNELPGDSSDKNEILFSTKITLTEIKYNRNMLKFKLKEFQSKSWYTAGAQ